MTTTHMASEEPDRGQPRAARGAEAACASSAAACAPRPFDGARLDQAEALLFPGGAQLGWRDLVSYAAAYCAGAYWRDGDLHVTTMGRPLHLVADVHFLRVRNDGAQLPLSAFPHDDATGALIPFVGSFHTETGVLPDGVLAEAGITWLRDAADELVEYPMFAATARSLLLLCRVPLAAVVIDGRPRLLQDAETMLKIYDEVQPGWSTELLGIVERFLPTLYQERQPGVSFEEFKRAEHDRVVFNLGLQLLQKAAAHPALAEHVKLSQLQCCGIQFKGSGCYHYDAHHVELNAEEVRAQPHLRLIEEKAHGGCLVVDARFLGAAGILLWLPHQQDFSVPLGAAATEESRACQREQAIFERGGRLAAITLGVIPLLNRGQVPELCCAEIGAAVVAVLDDSRRMDGFTDERIPLEGRRDYYMGFVAEKFGRPPREGEDERRWGEEQFAACREKHFAELFEGLGCTVRAVLEANLTNPRNQDLMGNINVCGGIADARNLMEMRGPHDATGLIGPLLVGLDCFGESAGFTQGEIFQQPAFHAMVRAFAGAEAEAIIGFTQSRHFRTGERFKDGVQLTKLSGLMTDAWVRLAGETPAGGYYLSDAEMVDYLASSVEARRQCGIDANTLRTFQLHLQQPHRVTINRFDGVITLEDALEPFRAGLERRLADLPTIHEHEGRG